MRRYYLAAFVIAAVVALVAPFASSTAKSLNGLAYVDIHTEQNPISEVRGEITQ